MRVVGWSFIALTAYIEVDAGHVLYAHEVPEKFLPGLIITMLSVIIMPALAATSHRFICTSAPVGTYAGGRMGCVTARSIAPRGCTWSIQSCTCATSAGVSAASNTKHPLP